MSNLYKGYLLGISAALIWCGFILVSRMGGISELSSYDVIAIRYVTCSAILLPIWLYFRITKHTLGFNLITPKLLITSLVGGLGYALCTFKGFELAPASHAAVLLPGLIPFLIIGLAIIVNGEVPSLAKIVGMVVIAIGISMLLYKQITQSNDISQGHVLLALGALCWAVFTLLIKRWNITPWQATVSLAIITCIMYMPVYVLWLPKNLSSNLLEDIVLQMAYQGVMATIIQMYLYVKAVQLIGVSPMGALMAIVPVVSGIAAIVIFNEAVSHALIVGLVLVSLGAWLAHSKILDKKPINHST
jgi:drug/metabolite transporter (DMT)-like permease